MEKVVSATEARINFGKMMRRVVEEQQAIIVERSGQPQIVLVSIAEYERLKTEAAQRASWVDQVQRARAQIADELTGHALPPIDDIIRQMREERDVQLLDLR